MSDMTTRTAKKQHIYCVKICGWRFYISNYRLKKMNPAAVRRRQAFFSESIASCKKRRYKLNQGRCDLCGQPIRWDDVQIHHVLPYGEFPQYGLNPKNMEIACEECHHALHLNPYRNLERMEAKAREFGFDLREYFSEKEQKARENYGNNNEQ